MCIFKLLVLYLKKHFLMPELFLIFANICVCDKTLCDVFVSMSVPSKLTRAVYPAESLRFGSVPFCSKDVTLCRSPSIAADQIPAQMDDTQHHHWTTLIWISQIRSDNDRKKHAPF